jgi:hypothetical protein
MTINPNLPPKSGYFFRDSDGVRHFADSWGGVIARVKAFRKRRGISEGDVAAEVIAQACSREPILCQPGSGEAHAAAVRKTTLKSRILSWLLAVKQNTEKRFVEQSLARQRADICARCPRQVPLPGGCASCTNTVIALRRDIVGPERFLDGRLTECDVLSEDTQITVHIEMQALENSELPAHCWRKRSL